MLPLHAAPEGSHKKLYQKDCTNQERLHKFCVSRSGPQSEELEETQDQHHGDGLPPHQGARAECIWLWGLMF